MNRFITVMFAALLAVSEASFRLHETDLKHVTHLRKDDPVKLPEQGYEGKGVRHSNMKSITKDWGTEYGPTTQAPPIHSSARGMTVAMSVLAAFVAMRAF